MGLGPFRRSNSIAPYWTANYNVATCISGGVNWELRAGTKPIRLVNLEVRQRVAAISEFGLGFPPAIGVTPTLPIGLIEHGLNRRQSQVQMASVWATPPSAPTMMFASTIFSANVASQKLWEWEDLRIDANKSIALYSVNVSANNSLIITPTIEADD